MRLLCMFQIVLNFENSIHIMPKRILCLQLQKSHIALFGIYFLQLKLPGRRVFVALIIFCNENSWWIKLVRYLSAEI
jgi:hypothetical protein